ncbi:MULTISPECIES: hypothetical protein [Rhizobium]|uniref:hypothetical protein n=1 Tax=Rhizobium TaxID=379 RepID=UPI001FDEE569|nr:MULTISPECIES: hypothetical protein [Rhizobium]
MRGETDRDVAPKAPPETIEEDEDHEHVKTTASSRPAVVDRKTNTYHRLESGLERDLVKLFFLRDDVVSIKAQDGPHRYKVEGKFHEHIIDVAAGLDDGSVEHWAVKPEGPTAEQTRAEMKLLNNQHRKDGGDEFFLATSEDISKARVNFAGNILHTREVANEFETARVHEALLELGGRARIWQLAVRLPDLYLSAVRTAVWDLIDKGLAVHDHPSPEAVVVSAGSWILAVGKD